MSDSNIMNHSDKCFRLLMCISPNINILNIFAFINAYAVSQKGFPGGTVIKNQPANARHIMR